MEEIQIQSEYSNRVRERFTSPAFRLESVPQKGDYKRFKANLQIPGVALELFYLLEETENGLIFKDIRYTTNLDTPYLAYVDAAIELINGRPFHYLHSLTPREVESFLRDRNDTMAFQKGGGVELFRYHEFVSGLYQHIKSESAGPKIKKSPTVASDYLPIKNSIYNADQRGPFLELNRDEQLDLIELIFEKMIRPFLKRDGGDAQIVHLDSSMVVVEFLSACRFCQYSLTSTMDYIQHVYRNELNHHSMMVVTDN